MNDKTKYFLENKRESNLRKIGKKFKCRFCFLSERLLKLIRWFLRVLLNIQQK